ncbi:MAG: AtpZ/AtpI family protein [Rhodothermales bacterium]|nr:AtpZ/AtpI family protein [Rhodothermales bacterium]
MEGPGDAGPPKPGKDWRTGLREAGPLLGLGIQVGLTMAVFAGGGVWLDTRFGTAPIFTLLGTGFAALSLGLLLARIVKDQDRRSGRRKRE